MCGAHQRIDIDIISMPSLVVLAIPASLIITQLLFEVFTSIIVAGLNILGYYGGVSY